MSEPATTEPTSNLPPTETTSSAPTSRVDQTPVTTEAAPDIDYVETALTVLEATYYASAEVDWTEMDQAATADLPDDPSPSRAYDAIQSALFDLADPHSYFVPPRQRQDMETVPKGIEPPVGERLRDIGYIELPAIANWNIDPNNPTEYADTVNQMLNLLDNPEPACGWVIALRNNGGGTTGPMLASLGPLLGEGVVLTATTPGGTQTISVASDWTITYDFEQVRPNPTANLPLLTDFSLEGTTAQETTALIEAALTVSEPVYQPAVEDPPVAVLTSNVTASAAEYVVVAFLGRDNTRTFGTTTAGMPTGIAGFQFVDGGILGVAATVPSDRQGNAYSAHIVPDQFIGFSRPGEDAPLDAALEWLRNEPPCAGAPVSN